jgi:hypothetical protein
MSEIAEQVLTATEAQIPTVRAEPPKQKKPVTKIRSIVVDTFTAFQKNQVLEKWDNGKATQDDWRDYGTDIVLFVKKLKERGFEPVLILGYEGSGKSYGVKALPPKTNIWFNADNKPVTYKGGKLEYGTPANPSNYMIIPKGYDEVLNVVDRIKAKGNLHGNPIAFLIGHVEDYKSANGVQRQRLKTLGKLTNKVNIEDMFTMCYYTEAVKDGDKMKFSLRTQNSGYDTGRSLEAQHETLFIENNFQKIIDSIDAY